MDKNSLTEEYLASMKECFNILDKDRDGKLTADEIKMFIRALGQVPSEKELTKKLKASKTTTYTFNDSVDAFCLVAAAMPPKMSFLKCLKYFDKEESGYLTRSMLQQILKTGDLPMKDEEIKTVLDSLGVKEKQPIDYVDLVDQ